MGLGDLIVALIERAVTYFLNLNGVLALMALGALIFIVVMALLT
jgi:hypothetical protein